MIEQHNDRPVRPGTELRRPSRRDQPQAGRGDQAGRQVRVLSPKHQGHAEGQP